jgi:hypothetical protein
MAASTGPVLAIAAVTLSNTLLFDDGPPDWNTSARVVVAAGITAGGLAILERAAPDVAVALAWAAFATMMLVRVAGRPSPSERILEWWNEARK